VFTVRAIVKWLCGEHDGVKLNQKISRKSPITAWNLAEERNQLEQFELIAAGHLRSGNRELATRFNDLIRATKHKIAALEKLEQVQQRPKSKTA